MFAAALPGRSPSPAPLMRTLVAALALLVSVTAASAQSKDAPPAAVRTALDHLQSRASALGLSEADVSDLHVSSAHQSQRSGQSYVYVQQRIGGIDVADGVITVAVGRSGQVAHTAGRLVGGTARASKAPALSAEAAVQRVAGLVRAPAPALQRSRSEGGAAQKTAFGRIADVPVTARLVYVPTDADGLRLAWEVQLPVERPEHVWLVRLDAQTGAELSRMDLIVHDAYPADHAAHAEAPRSLAPLSTPSALAFLSPAMAGSYTVYPMPIEAPLWATPAPPADARSVVANAEDATASPFGWHDTNGVAGAEYTITRGNNTHAYLDRDDNEGPDAGGEPDGGAGLTFNFPLDLTQDPSTYTDASVTNLFYWSNVIHDVMYQYGFDEASGNFQANNYGRGGTGGDAVDSESQSGADICNEFSPCDTNANFFTPSDGNEPRMQMYVGTIPTPTIDGSFDAGVVVHEYGHGISNRLVGGRTNVSCLGNDEQMGEGWSDWYGLMMTMEASDTRTTLRPIGNYLIGQGQGGGGIRATPYQPSPGAPYTTNFAVNSATYGDSNSGLSRPHGVGFVWATILWEVTWDMIDAHGFDADLYDAAGTAGNQIMMNLVTEGLKLTPCGPGFVDGRDAILAADAALYPDASNPGQGLHYNTLWQAFARRGLGASASQGSANSRSDQTEAFDTPLPPPSVSVSPSSVSRTVEPGGTASATVTVGNTAGGGSGDLSYTATVTNLTQPLAVRASTPIATEKTVPQPTGRLEVLTSKSAETTQEVQRRDVSRTQDRLAGGPDAFGYVFADSDEAGGPAASFQDISGTGTPISFSDGDEGSASVALPFSFPFYGTDRTTAYVSTNGYISFANAGLTVWQNAGIPTSGAPNALLAPYWDDLHQRSGTAYAGTLPDGRFVIQWSNWGRYSPSSGESLNFQVILSDDGTIEYQYGSLTTTVGNSATVGIENDGGTGGLEVAFNEAYITANKAVRFTTPLLWASVAPGSGSIAPGASEDLTVSFDASELPEGVYTADLVIASNDPETPSVTVPLTLTVETGGAGSVEFALTQPAGDVMLTCDRQKLRIRTTTTNTTGSAFAAQYWAVGVQTAGGSFGPRVVHGPKAIAVDAGGSTESRINQTVPRSNRDRAFDYTIYLGDFTAGDPLVGDGAIASLSFSVDQDCSLLTEPSTDPVESLDAMVETPESAPTTAQALTASGQPELALESVVPNPARGRAAVAFSLAEAGEVRLSVVDVRGREVAVLAEGSLDAGAHRAPWATEALAPGVYVIRLQAGADVLTRQAVVVR